MGQFHALVNMRCAIYVQGNSSILLHYSPVPTHLHSLILA